MINRYSKFLTGDVKIDLDDVSIQVAEWFYGIGLLLSLVMGAFGIINQDKALMVTNGVMSTYFSLGFLYLKKTKKFKVPLFILFVLFPIGIGLRTFIYNGALSPTIMTFMLLTIMGPVLFNTSIGFFITNLNLLVTVFGMYCEQNSLFGLSPKGSHHYYNHWMLLTILAHYAAFFIVRTLNNKRIIYAQSIQIEKNMKELLLRAMSHDLSSPLSTILGSLYLIEKDYPEIKTKRYFASIQEASQSTVNIVRTVRDFEAIHSGKKSLSLTSVDLKDCFQACRENFHQQIEKKKINLKTDFDPQLPLVKTHKDIVSFQIFSNILSNAIKYSPTGSDIEIGMKKSGSHIDVYIADFGKGMTDEMLKNVNARAELHSTLGTEGEQGTGFGIPILFSFASILGIRVLFERNGERPGTRVGLKFQV